VNAACQGNLSAWQLWHVCHRFASPPIEAPIINGYLFGIFWLLCAYVKKWMYNSWVMCQIILFHQRFVNMDEKSSSQKLELYIYKIKLSHLNSVPFSVVLVVYPLLFGFPFFLVPQGLENVKFLQDALHFSWRGLGHLRSCFHCFNLHLAAHVTDTKLEECISYCSTQHFPSSFCATFNLNCSLKWILLCICWLHMVLAHNF